MGSALSCEVWEKLVLISFGNLCQFLRFARVKGEKKQKDIKFFGGFRIDWHFACWGREQPRRHWEVVQATFRGSIMLKVKGI
jgi:hypothetical protein